MTIECYNKQCKHHGIHHREEGPFCFENNCNFEELSTHPESIAALKANLHYYERLKMKAFEEHKAALINYHQALSALNEAIVKECGRG